MISGKTAEIGHLTGKIVTGGTLSGKITNNEAALKATVHNYVGSGGDIYTGEYTVIPKVNDDQILETKEKLMADDVTVFAIPYYETSNVSGITVYIGGE